MGSTVSNTNVASGTSTPVTPFGGQQNHDGRQNSPRGCRFRLEQPTLSAWSSSVKQLATVGVVELLEVKRRLLGVPRDTSSHVTQGVILGVYRRLVY